MGTNRDIKSDGNVNITSTQTNISGDLDVTGSINNFNFPASDGIDGQALVTNGAGTLSFADAGAGGAGGINYITNTRATTDTTGYATYADAATTTPADGTGGSANITFTRNTTTPLRDNGDFKIAKDAANRQGEGVGCAFTIDNADKARKLVISFDYDASHSSYADDDIKIFIYDVTNTNLIRVNGEDLKGGKGKHYAQFQTASNSTSYRLIFHVSSTNASAYNVFLDEISVGPQTISHGTINTDWIAYTPSKSNFTTSHERAFYKRVGDSIIVKYAAKLNAAVTGTMLIDLPSGLSADQDKITGANGDVLTDSRLGLAVTYEAGAGDHHGSVSLYDTNTIRFFGDDGAGAWAATVPYTWASNDELTFVTNPIPIEGWSSNAKTSEDFGGREIKVIASGSSASALSANTERIDWTISTDSTGSFSTTDNGPDTFTCPETGTYAVDGVCALSLGTAGTQSIRAFINNVANIYVHIAPSSTTTRYKKVNGMVFLEKGDTLDFRLDATGTIENDTTIHWLHIQKIASPQTILENETVAMTLEGLNSGDQALSNATGTKVVNWGAAASDTHGAWDSGNSKYVIPVTGYYQINFGSHVTDEASTVGLTSVTAHIYIDGSPKQRKTMRQPAASNCESQVSALISLTKGQYVEFYTRYDGDGNVDASNDVFNGSQYTFASIHRIK